MANPQALQPIHGAGREALLRALDGTGTTGVPDGLLLSCTCGHMYVAAGDEDAG